MSLPTTYQKLVATRHSETFREAVDIIDTELTEPAANEIVVKTHYSGVNAADYLMAAGRYIAATKPPFDLGAEATGEIVAVGSDVQHLNVGDAVLALSGGYREYFTVQADYAIPVPQPTPQVVALGVSGLTASIALSEVGEMTGGETVLVTAAAGGTGNFAVQLAKIAGNHVIGTCGNDEKADLLRRLGCDYPINYNRDDVRAVLKEDYPAGVDIVFECVGGELYDAALDNLAVKGRMILIGAISEYKSGPERVSRPRALYKLLGKSASLRGFWLMHYLKHAPDHAAKLLRLMNDGTLTIPVDDQHFRGVAGAIEAIEYLYSGENVGKVVVDFTEA